MVEPACLSSAILYPTAKATVHIYVKLVANSGSIAWSLGCDITLIHYTIRSGKATVHIYVKWVANSIAWSLACDMTLIHYPVRSGEIMNTLIVLFTHTMIMTRMEILILELWAVFYCYLAWSPLKWVKVNLWFTIMSAMSHAITHRWRTVLILSPIH